MTLTDDSQPPRPQLAERDELHSNIMQRFATECHEMIALALRKRANRTVKILREL